MSKHLQSPLNKENLFKQNRKRTKSKSKIFESHLFLSLLYFCRPKSSTGCVRPLQPYFACFRCLAIVFGWTLEFPSSSAVNAEESSILSRFSQSVRPVLNIAPPVCVHYSFFATKGCLFFSPPALKRTEESKFALSCNHTCIPCKKSKKAKEKSGIWNEIFSNQHAHEVDFGRHWAFLLGTILAPAALHLGVLGIAPARGCHDS